MKSPNSPRRVVVTGRSVLTGGVSTVPEFWSAAGRGALLPVTLPNREMLRDLAALEKADASILARHQLLALASVERAWVSSGLPAHRNRLRGEGVKQRYSRIGCVNGTSLGGLAAMEEEVFRADRRFSPYSLSRWRGNSVGMVASVRYGLGGAEFCINAASATGSQVLFLAATLVRSGMLDAVVAVAADPAVPPLLEESMFRSGSITRDPGRVPLSAGRSGMHPVEGAACLILESAEHAAARGVSPVAEWLGGESASGAHHLLAPETTGGTLEELLRCCLRETVATRHGGGVDWISLHATGTPRFDALEIATLKRVFPEAMPWITAFKRFTGHALAASGLIEAIGLTEGLRTGEVPPWPVDTDPELGLDALRPAVAPHPSVALQLGQGMGGVVVVNALGAVTPQGNPVG